MYKTAIVLDIVKRNNDIKAGRIAEIFEMPINSVSGILSILKSQQRVSNKHSLWYAESRMDKGG